MTTPLTILLVLSIFSFCFLSSSTLDGLSEGSSISVENEQDVLASPDGTFHSGFFPIDQDQGNAYSFAIWFSKPCCRANCTIVWMANRDRPVNGKYSELSLLKSGNLVLTDADHSKVWQTSTVSLSSTYLSLQDNGNLVLRNSEGLVLWQSFDFPTDTLLPLQPLTKKTQLVSSRSETNFSSGFFRLYFDSDNVLRLLFDSPDVSSVYWPDPELLSWEAKRSTFNSSRIALLDALGNFSSTDNFNFLSADYGVKIQRRLKLDHDGNVRLYTRKEDLAMWVVSWQAMSEPCRIHGSCGPNSICRYVPAYGRKCSCIPGFKMKNHTDWSFGCEPDFYLPCNQTDVGFLKLTHVEFYGYDYGFYANYSLKQCQDLCSSICNCKGFQFKPIKVHYPDGTYCYPKTLLLNGHRSTNYQGDLYLKVPKANLSPYQVPVQDSKLDCPAYNLVLLDRTYAKGHKNSSAQFVLWSALAIGAIEFIVIFSVWCFLMIRSSDDQGKRQGYVLALTGFRKFSYSELKKATNGFKEEIGRGSGGIVYKGILPDGRVAAIKHLIDANQGEAEFLAEVSTIGKLNHMNLIDMWGYCVGGKHKLLVFEYMEHGSLAKNLSSNTLDWRKRFEIAIGTAKGLAYLHEECLEWVLHCDIKPQNILLDSDYRPKVSDFGLSWLLNRGDVKVSRFSRMRGTRGYMAPEWISNFPITSKVDVYSYGIVLLEIVTGKSPIVQCYAEEERRDSEPRTLVKWVKLQMAGGSDREKKIGKIIDPKLDGNYNIDEMEILVNVALKCVEEDKDVRPTMGQVVKMLLGYSERVVG